MNDIALHLGDCLEVMAGIPDESINLVLCDLPYGTTACAWDSVIPFEPLWGHYRRVLKANGAVVLTASQPFTSALVMSNTDWFRYTMVWEKSQPTGHLDAKRRPLKAHEDIAVFSPKAPPYNPQGTVPVSIKSGRETKSGNGVYGSVGDPDYVQTIGNYPRTVLSFGSVTHGIVHPTQKPVPLFEYLILTYSNPSDLILDNTMGSGTTLVACINTGRHGIGIEKDPAYFAIAEQRIADARLRQDRPHAPPLRLKPEPADRSLFDAFTEAS